MSRRKKHKPHRPPEKPQSEPSPAPASTTKERRGLSPRVREWLCLTAILLVATLLRFLHLGRLSLWYDEVVPMRLARQPDLAALFRLLFQIEATRAPLHPLVLHYWLRVFGTSDVAGRSLSAVCGVLTVWFVHRIGRRLYDDTPTALWAAWLSALSPLLVRYAQEAKMYAWLTLLTCVAWDCLLALRDAPTRARLPRLAALVLTQIALIYSQPLGLFMVAAQGLAYLACRRAYALDGRVWLGAQAVVLLAVLPWVGHYLDHPPESTTGGLPIRFLLGLPIGFVGGNSLTLVLMGLLALRGVLHLRRGQAGTPRALTATVDHPVAVVTLLLWFAVPPLLLYGYSLVAHPIFGPARYTLFVGPAYLLLLARGLARVAWVPRLVVAVAMAGLSLVALGETVYAPDLKADWRAAAALIRRSPARPTVVVLSSDPAHNLEVETARYYLGPAFRVMGVAEAEANPPSGPVVFATGLQNGRPIVPLPPALTHHHGWPRRTRLPGLQLDWRGP